MDRRNTEDGLELLQAQWSKFPSLTIGYSSLGEAVGLGLFARRDISCSENNGMLLPFFGKIIVATEEQVSEIYKHFFVHPNIKF
jgi:predicted alpha-1,6-mannanase (GH76 family)